MRTRLLKPGFFKNEQLAELPFSDRLLYAGLWLLADRAGKLESRAKRIKAEIFPFDEVDVEQSIARLVSAELILKYEVDGVPYLLIPSFTKHQHPHHREPASIIPDQKPRSGPRRGRDITGPVPVEPQPSQVKVGPGPNPARESHGLALTQPQPSPVDPVSDPDTVLDTVSKDHSLPPTDPGNGRADPGNGAQVSGNEPAAPKRQRKPKAPAEPLAFSITALLAVLAEASKGAIVTEPFDQGLASSVTRTIRAMMAAKLTLEDARLAAEWIAEGGDSWRDHTVSWVSTTGALIGAIGQARKWNAEGRPSPGRNTTGHVGYRKLEHLPGNYPPPGDTEI